MGEAVFRSASGWVIPSVVLVEYLFSEVGLSCEAGGHSLWNPRS